MNTYFTGPDGIRKELIDNIELFTHILHSNETYWNVGSGDSSIGFTDNKYPVLLLMYSPEKDGFHIEILESSEIFDPLVAVDRTLALEPITLYIGGSEYVIPSFTVISRDKTKEIVEYFIENRKKDPKNEWQRLFSLR
ncbi:hypothetical protein HGA91_05375 [candidate division WWE3 bacterium]|nr:hypothetical protein [candidate division WWE3 bacterium]